METGYWGVCAVFVSFDAFERLWAVVGRKSEQQVWIVFE